MLDFVAAVVFRKRVLLKCEGEGVKPLAFYEIAVKW